MLQLAAPRPVTLLLAALALTAALPEARAHQSSTTYSTVEVSDSGEVRYSLLLSTRDLYEALSLEKDREATEEEIRAGESRLFDYVLDRIDVMANDKRCTPQPTGLELVTQAERRVELLWTARCPTPRGRMVIDYRLFFDLDPRHMGMLLVAHEGKMIQRELTRELARFEWDLGAAPPPSMDLLDYVGSGVEHIFTGYDHIAFVVALLLVAAIRRGQSTWEPRGTRAGAVYVAKVVTAFTVAHSVTLIAAALDWLVLPSRLVESAIAASIIYVAVENVALPEPRWRGLVACGFGLVHGMGFASLLRPLLPPSGVVLPLLAFNVGVELGQLAIVALLLPALCALAERDASRYRKVVVLGGSGVVGLLGLLWLLERAAELRVFG
jgi:hydrogenase/urease accessory protein HupE